jgi:hypothetical protein
LVEPLFDVLTFRVGGDFFEAFFGGASASATDRLVWSAAPKGYIPLKMTDNDEGVLRARKRASPVRRVIPEKRRRPSPREVPTAEWF